MSKVQPIDVSPEEMLRAQSEILAAQADELAYLRATCAQHEERAAHLEPLERLNARVLDVLANPPPVTEALLQELTTCHLARPLLRHIDLSARGRELEWLRALAVQQRERIEEVLGWRAEALRTADRLTAELEAATARVAELEAEAALLRSDL